MRKRLLLSRCYQVLSGVLDAADRRILCSVLVLLVSG